MSVAAVVRAALVAVGGGNGGVAPVGLLRHGRAELVVVGADEPERDLRVDGKNGISAAISLPGARRTSLPCLPAWLSETDRRGLLPRVLSQDGRPHVMG